MADSRGKALETLSDSLADHSLEGVELLTAVPSRLIRTTIVVISGLLLAAFVWSFVGRADVIVSAPGRLAQAATLSFSSSFRISG